MTIIKKFAYILLCMMLLISVFSGCEKSEFSSESLKAELVYGPWLTGSFILLFVTALIAFFLLRSSIISKRLDVLVKKQTYELALQAAILTTLFDSIPDLIFTKNLDLKFLHCNKAMLEHFEKNIDDLVGKDDFNGLGLTLEEADAFNKMDRLVINEKKTIKIEEHIPRFDGSNPFYETIKMPLIQDGNVVGIMGISRDITKRKETEEAALAASQSKSTFLANMSHEIRTPMNAILGVTEILMHNDNLSFDIEEGLGKIYSSCDLLLGIINDILDFSKIEAGKLDIIPAHYKVASMINDSVHLNMMRIESKPIEFELRIHENVPAKLIGDELRIKQILNNLLSNAFKYTDTGKVKLSIIAETARENSPHEARETPLPDALKTAADSRISSHHGRVPLKNDNVTLVISVQDTGHGMTKEQLDRMFDEYSRFEHGKKNPAQGTGLGLAITKRLVKLMNGKMYVESEPGAGTFFIIRLPQGFVDAEVLGKEVAENLKQFRMSYLLHRRRGQIIRDPMPYGNVLIVDDVETNLYVAEGLMKLYKLQIDTAMSGADVIYRIKSGKKYDIIFMDHMMPGMDGIEATKELRGFGYKEPVVALTANAVAGQADMFLDNGFDDFISKPIDIRQLNAILNKYVRDKQPPDVIEAARQQIDKNSESNILNRQVDSFLLASFIRDAKRTIECWEEQVKPVLLFNNGFDNPLKKHESNIEALKKFTIVVHGIKSSLWNIGEELLSELAAKLEKSGREHNLEQVTVFAPEFMDELRIMLEKVELQRDNDNLNRICADEDTGFILEKMTAIKEMSQDYNRKGILDIVAEIKNCSQKTRTALDSIMGYALHSEFDEAENAAAAFIADLSSANNKT